MVKGNFLIILILIEDSYFTVHTLGAQDVRITYKQDYRDILNNSITINKTIRKVEVHLHTTGNNTNTTLYVNTYNDNPYFKILGGLSCFDEI